MKNYNHIIRFRNKFPRIYRISSFEIIKAFNFLSYYILLPLKIYIERKLRIKLLSSKSLNKVIIRKDRLGDCILTLPFIYGLKLNEKDLFFVSEILEKIIIQLNIKCSFRDSQFLKNDNDLLIANLSTSKINSFQSSLPKVNKKILFTQLSTNPFSKNGIPIVFEPNYLKNKSQTLFIKNCFKLLNINADPIRGIKYLNRKLENIVEYKKNNLLVIVVGLGIDIGRQLKIKTIRDIIQFAKKNSLNPVILEEPNFENKLKAIANENNIESKSCRNFLELFILFKNSRYVIGYDCGPTHIASLLTNSIILFSHTPCFHWGKHVWHKFIQSKKIISGKDKIIITKQLNLGSLKNNWIISYDFKGCALHKKVCQDNNCSELDEYLIQKAIRSILKDPDYL